MRKTSSGSGRRSSPGDSDPDKAPEAYRTISEVSQHLGVPQHVLRFWETKFAQLRPMKRGGGRRYYRPEDVELLRKIYGWLYEEGLTIRGVQKRLRGRGSKQALALPDHEEEAGERMSAATRRALESILADLKSLRGQLR